MICSSLAKHVFGCLSLCFQGFFPTLRNDPQSFAWGLYGRACGEFCKSGRFCRFKTSRSLVSRGRPGTSWHSDVFRNEFRRWVAFFVASSALWTPPSLFCLTGASLWRCAVACYFANRIVGAASSGDNVQIAWQGRRDMLWHAIKLNTLHSTLYTPHSILYTPHSTLYTVHSPLHTLKFTLHTLHSTLYTPHFTLYTLHSTIATSHSTHYIPHSTLHFLHTYLCTPPSPAFHSLECTGTEEGKNAQDCSTTCFTQVFYVTAFGLEGCILFGVFSMGPFPKMFKILISFFQASGVQQPTSALSFLFLFVAFQI